MDRKEVGRTAQRPGRRSAPVPKRRTWGWRRLLVGAVFVLGVWALMLVFADELQAAGRIVLAAGVLVWLEFSTRREPLQPSGRMEEFASLGDLLCFSAVPGFLFYRLLLKDQGLLGVAGVFAVIFAGVLRLSLYKFYYPDSGQRGVIGIPLAMTGAGIGAAAQVITPGMLQPGMRLVFLALAGCLAFLNVSTIRYPKAGKGFWWAGWAALAAAAVFWGPPVAKPAVWLLLGAGALYIIFAPWRAGERR